MWRAFGMWALELVFRGGGGKLGSWISSLELKSYKEIYSLQNIYLSIQYICSQQKLIMGNYH